MKNSVFSFFISKSDVCFCEMSQKQIIGDYIMYSDSNTPLEVHQEGDRICAIFGYAVNLLDQNTKKITEYILNNSQSLQDVIDIEYSLGGKYLLLYKDNVDCFVLGDATCSVPIYYTASTNDFMCASTPMLIVKAQSISPDTTLQHIRDSSHISQAMPFDYTEYKEVKQLIPNHYLSFSVQKSFRFVNCSTAQRELSVQKATQMAMPLIERLTHYYLSKFKIYCPITSGRDSRVVLSVLSALTSASVDCYTMKHEEHRVVEQDLIIPPKLSSVCNMNYRQIVDIPATNACVEKFDAYLGENRYSIRTLNIAHTIHSYFADGAIINGDIIGQVGKCSLHRDIPCVLATAGYFRCKLHNYSSEAKIALKNWISDVRDSGEQVNLFDLFSIENRLGRWAAQENQIYNAMGQLYFNIFNSRSIIYIWTAVRRSERKKALLHLALIKEFCHRLLEVPFEKDESIFIKFSKSNGLFYYVSSFLKHYMEKCKFMRGRK